MRRRNSDACRNWLGLTGVILVLLASTALSSPVTACVRTSTEAGGPCLWWGRRALAIRVSQAGSDDLKAGSEFDAIERSLSTWTDASCSDLQLDYDGLTSREDVGYAVARPDNINLIVWREQTCRALAPAADPCWDCLNTGGVCCGSVYHCWEYPRGVIAVTSTTFSRQTGELFDADIELNGVDYWFTTLDGPACTDPAPAPRCQGDTDCLSSERCVQGECLSTTCARTDVENTVTHELGHVVGLDHSPVPAATMYPSAADGEIEKRSLDQDDLECLCTAYPAGGPTRTCFGREVSFHSQGSHRETRGCGGCGQTGAPLRGLWLLLTLLVPLRRPQLKISGCASARSKQEGVR